MCVPDQIHSILFTVESSLGSAKNQITQGRFKKKKQSEQAFESIDDTHPSWSMIQPFLNMY